jgi:hypothetical protein
VLVCEGLFVLPRTMTIDRVVPETLTPTKPYKNWKAASPATSPSFMPAISTATLADDCGPNVRCVSVFLAFRIDVLTLPVVNRRNPGRAESDQRWLSGLWFHCHATPSR